VKDRRRKRYIVKVILCKTLANNNVDLLTITEMGSQQDISERKGVVITARVHPGDSNSSFVMKGLIEFLTSEHEDAIALRRIFVFKIVPMINVDGVMCGNYRCSLSGIDLNRVWK
jgi:murein tripeptide amidase MpaA